VLVYYTQSNNARYYPIKQCTVLPNQAMHGTTQSSNARYYPLKQCTVLPIQAMHGTTQSSNARYYPLKQCTVLPNQAMHSTDIKLYSYLLHMCSRIDCHIYICVCEYVNIYLSANWLKRITEKSDGLPVTADISRYSVWCSEWGVCEHYCLPARDAVCLIWNFLRNNCNVLPNSTASHVILISLIHASCDRCCVVILTTRTNLIHFTVTFTLLKLQASTCFGHYWPILRRHCTNSFGGCSVL
jgi:hypothetical protein